MKRITITLSAFALLSLASASAQSTTQAMSSSEAIVPQTKRRAVVGIKVLNRHGAAFFYNNEVISEREALKLVRRNFEDLLIEERVQNNEIHLSDQTFRAQK